MTKKALPLFLFFLLLLPHPLFSQEGEPRDLFSQAYALFAKGELAQAEGLFLKTLERGYTLEDYNFYFLGLISFRGEDWPKARRYFSELRKSFPHSVWSDRAGLYLAKISVAEKNYQQAMEELQTLGEQTTPKDGVAEEARYLLGQIHELQGEPSQALSLYQQLRRASPLSSWAAKAKSEVRRIRDERPHLFGLAAPEELLSEGEVLLQERDYEEAERVYRRLLAMVPRGAERPRLLLGLANVYRGARKRAEGIGVLAEIVREYPKSPEAPQALFRLARTYWNRDDNLKALDHFRQLHKSYPKSPFADAAYFASARIYESLGKTYEAIRTYRDIPKRFPTSRWRDEAYWRLAWIHYLRADHGRSFTAFKQLANHKGAERYRTAALYWQARSAQKMGRSKEARQLYLQIAQGDEDSYYVGPAARALERMGITLEERKKTDANLSEEQEPSLSPRLSFHLARAEELARLSLSELALSELDALRELNGKDPALRLALIRLYASHGAYGRSVALANGFSPQSEELIKYRYPLAYWEAIQKIAAEKEMDPYLILALIRQESVFDPKALSPASAFGLMQLLPSTAGRVAAQLGLPPPQREKLWDADLNLMLGSQYLKDLLKRYSNSLPKAIAAYNAGENAVDRWEQRIFTDDEEEFIELIPYRETRLYVKLVLRNHLNYKRLYPNHP